MTKKRILLVDDDVTATGLLKLSLEGTGCYEAKEENVASRVLSTSRSFKPDLIVLDVCMPLIDGGDVAATIKKDRIMKDVPIVFLTSIVSEEEAGEHPLMRGGYPFIPKPVNLQHLVRHIEDTLSSKHRAQRPPTSAS